MKASGTKSESKASESAISTRKRIFLIEDHTLFREGIKKVLADEPDFVVCGEAGAARNVIGQIATAAPDLVLLDISLPGMDGLELVKNLKAQNPDICMMALSMHAEDLYAERVIRAGAKGYIMKDASAEELLVAIRTVLAGGLYLSPKLSKALLSSMVSRRGEKTGVQHLSDRELEIFRLLGRGFTTAEIGENLNISVKTVESHRGNIRLKLKIKTGSQLLRLAIAHSAEELGQLPSSV